MKNIIIIDVDTEREGQRLKIAKPSDMLVPTSPEEAKGAILIDIACIFEAFKTMVLMADKSSYGKKEDFIKTAIKELSEVLTDNLK